jgi:hypothetical protein
MKINIFLAFFLSLAFLNHTYAQMIASPNLTMYGRGLYPGDDTVFDDLRLSGFTTVVLSSFYIHENGDVYSGDSRNPIIHDGKYIGDKEWLRRIASLKQKPGSVTRIELLLEGRWYNQPPNTFDFIRDWSDPNRQIPGIVTGTGDNSTLYKIAQLFKEYLGVDAVSIDDESVYDSVSVIRFGEILNRLNMHMSLCPFTNLPVIPDIPLPRSLQHLLDQSQQQESRRDQGRNDQVQNNLPRHEWRRHLANGRCKKLRKNQLRPSGSTVWDGRFSKRIYDAAEEQPEGRISKIKRPYLHSFK